MISYARSLFLTILTFVTFESNAQSQEFQKMTPKPGERCTVGNVPLTENDVTLLVRGRRVPLHRTMVDSFLNNQETYFRNLQPKGALFQEEMAAQKGTALGGMKGGWFTFGLLVLAGLICGGVSGYLAVSKGLPGAPFFFAGFFLNVFGIVYTLTKPAVVPKEKIPAGVAKIPSTSEPVPCKKCGSTNHPTANRCSGCSAEITPTEISEVTRA